MQKKICLVGAFAVGKTSLVRRFVHSVFSEKYQTTVGVKIDKKPVTVGGRDVQLLIWDLAGEDEFQQIRTTYLRGSSGFLFVADGTRPQTLDQAVELLATARQVAGPVPAVLAVNKVDLASDWELGEDAVAAAHQHGWHVFRTSALSGEGVDEAFRWLADAMLEV